MAACAASVKALSSSPEQSKNTKRLLENDEERLLLKLQSDLSACIVLADSVKRDSAPDSPLLDEKSSQFLRIVQDVIKVGDAVRCVLNHTE